jgi:hypothetical protein
VGFCSGKVVFCLTSRSIQIEREMWKLETQEEKRGEKREQGWE